MNVAGSLAEGWRAARPHTHRRLAAPVTAALVLLVLLAGGLLARRGYGVYVATHTPTIAVLLETSQSMRRNDPAGYARTLVDDIWNRAGPNARVYVITYGASASLAAERTGGDVVRPLPSAFGAADVTYASLPQALGLARRLMSASPPGAARTVLILSDGYPYPGPRVGTPAVGRGLAALRADGVRIHAVLFGTPGRASRPDATDTNMAHTAWLVMQWSGLFRPLAAASATGVLGPPSGSVAVAATGAILTSGAAASDRLLQPAFLQIGRADLLLLLALLYLAILAVFVVNRLRLSVVIWILACSDGSPPDLLLARRMIPGWSRPFQLFFSVATSELFTATLKDSHGEPAEGLAPLVAIRRMGYGWELTGEGGTHIYVGDGPPLRRVALEPGTEVRFGDFMVRAAGRPRRSREAKA